MKILEETKFMNGSNKELPYEAKQLTKIAAQDIMLKGAYFAQPDMPMEGLAEVFVNRNQNPIPVVDHSNKLLGIISRSDLIKLLAPVKPVHDKAYYDSMNKVQSRPIDKELDYIHGDLSSRFAFVAKAKANIWLTAIIVLFVAGFFIGILYVADPNIFFKTNPAPQPTFYDPSSP
jgi:predicted transcriptional regulator